MKLGDMVVVIGVGIIGVMIVLVVLVGGVVCVILVDVVVEKLIYFVNNFVVIMVDVIQQVLIDVVQQVIEGWGVDVVFEVLGYVGVYQMLLDLVCFGGCVVLVGMLLELVVLDVVIMQIKEVWLEFVFCYVNIFLCVLVLLSLGMIDVKFFILCSFFFFWGIEVFEEVVCGCLQDVKIQIEMEG